jgi:tetratricopeptide (TPR) repeat protein
VVEGSVQRAGGRVRVNVQLIDARNDIHVWAEHYDRGVADVFAVQTEIAQQIADQLKGNLSSAEKAAIAERPTTDLVAYAFYTKAKEIDVWDNWEDAEKSMAQKVELLEKATQRDPNFALAYCALAKAQADLGNFEFAKKGAEAALRVRPDLGEGHRELARYYYYTSDFDRAHDELIVARGRLPNDSETFRIAAEIDRIQNRWDASLANLQKASELDPRNVEVAWHLQRSYLRMRRYSELDQLLMKKAASNGQEDPWVNMVLAEIKLAQGDPVAAQSLLEQVPLDFSPTGQIWDTRFTAALYLRDYDAADHVIAVLLQGGRRLSVGSIRRVGLTEKLRVRVTVSRRRWQCLQPRARRWTRHWVTSPKMNGTSRSPRASMLGAVEKKRRSARHFTRSILSRLPRTRIGVQHLSLTWRWFTRGRVSATAR